ncbi:nuclear pore complex protein NUP107 [Tanacetum coccineum]
MSSMNIDMDEAYASPSSLDPQNLTLRERYRRYGKRLSPSPHNETYQSKFSNAALFLDNIKKEVDHRFDDEEGDRSARSSSKRRSPSPEMSVSHSLKVCKVEEEGAVVDGGDATFSLFASLFDSALQGLMSIPDLILRLEAACRNVSESIYNSCSERHRIVEDKLMRQKARLLLDEAASWSLLWYLYGKGTRNEEVPEDSVVLPTTSHVDACQFVADDHNAQLCFRLIQWLEGLASKALDLEMKVRGSHVGTHLPTSGVWNHTQRFLKKGSMNEKIVQHLDFDASTRELAQPLPDDKKQDESLLEDVWILLRAGRLEEACNLCRAAGQSWRAATLRPFGGMDQTPSVEALIRNGKNRSLQAMELESGINHQRRLWKWASFCASEKIAEQESGKYETAIYAANCSNVKRILPICTDWETACWALTKSWLDVQVDTELSGGIDQFRNSDGTIERSPGQGDLNSQSYLGPESWPLQVKNQQPHDLSALLQKLHSSESVHEAVSRGCKEQHRQIEMNLMMVDIPRLLDLIWSWISPSGNDEDIFRPHGDPQMIRFGAHLVLVLRHLLADDMKDSFKERLMTLGDLILHMYAMFLFSKQHEELVGIYASQLARHRCIDLFVHMMELRLNSSVHVRYKIFLSAIEYLPFSPGVDSDGSFEKGSFEEIIERVLSRSRELKVGKYDGSSDVTEQCRLQSLQKAMVVQWLCFTPPSTITDAIRVGTKLLLRALMHSNALFREFALISMWRIPALPSGAHTLLSLLAEPLKHPSETLSTEDSDASDSLREFEDWNEYYSCDATYRSWLQIELDNAGVDVSSEEKERATVVAMETLSSSMALLLREGNPWLVPTEDQIYDLVEPTNLELHATAMLCLPSGECMFPDATLCTSLTSALYSSVSDEAVSSRQLQVNVSISGKDSSSVEVALRCLATENDGFGPNKLADGGILAAVIAAGVKGELARFQAGVTMEIMRVDAWYSGSDGSLGNPATYILRGLSRRCCIPELILRCMQVSVSLMESGNAHESHDELIELVASSETGILHLFSQNQLQEFLLFEREYCIWKMELLGESAV